jgi:hypothetical protein
LPELPDVTVYIEALDARIRGAQLLGVRLARPFALRSVEPPLSTAAGLTCMHSTAPLRSRPSFRSPATDPPHLIERETFTT